MLFIGIVPLLFALDFPEKHITWIVGYKPGDGFDTYSGAKTLNFAKSEVL